MKNGQDRLFFGTLIEFGRFIDENYDEEGFLPSEGNLCEMFKVSRRTIRGVVATFSANNVIKSYPKKGHYVVPKRHRVKKIGIVVGDGRESPFLQNPDSLAVLISRLKEEDVFCQIIQSSQAENIKWRALAHGVKALVWIEPTERMLPIVFDKKEKAPFPQLVISIGNLEATRRACRDDAYIIPDIADVGRRKARFFLGRDCGDVVYIGEKSKGYDAFCAEFEKNGTPYDDSLFVDASENYVERLKTMVAESRFSGIALAGSGMDREKIIDVIDDSPERHRIQVLLPDKRGLDSLKERYPQINFVAYSISVFSTLGDAAARELIDYIYKRIPIKSREVQGHEIKLIKS